MFELVASSICLSLAGHRSILYFQKHKDIRVVVQGLYQCTIPKTRNVPEEGQHKQSECLNTRSLRQQQPISQLYICYVIKHYRRYLLVHKCGQLHKRQQKINKTHAAFLSTSENPRILHCYVKYRKHS